MADVSRLARIAQDSLAADIKSGLKTASDVKSSMARLTSTRTITGGVGTSSASLKRLSTWYLLPTSTSEGDKIKFFLYLTLCYAGDRTVDMSAHMNLLVTMLGLLYSQRMEEMLSNEVQHERLTAVHVSQISSIVDVYAHSKGCSDEELGERFKNCGWNPNRVNLPLPIDYEDDLIGGVPELLSLYAYLGVLCVACVKDASGSGEAALTTARFKAIREKYKLTKEGYPFLGGDAAPSISSFVNLTESWKRLPVTRRVMFSHFGKIASISGSAEDEALFTTIKLMKFADMVHVSIIGSFLVAYPWAAQLPSLQASIINYDNETGRLLNMCPDLADNMGRKMYSHDRKVLKDAALLPYAKLIHGDGLDIAKRDTMLPLLYVAKRQMMINFPTLSNYQVPEEFPLAFEEFEITLRFRAGGLHEDETAEDDEGADEE